MQTLAQAWHHIEEMPERNQVEDMLKSSTCNLALQMCQASGNIPPAIGTGRDECAFTP